MGNTESTRNNNKAARPTNNKAKGKKKKNEGFSTSYRRSIRSSKRAQSSSRTVDTRQIMTSRACEKPVVASGTLWEDPCFPREMAMEGSRMENMNYRWMRPKQFCERPTLVGAKPSRHDVLQGTIGNCWMMAVLAGIADNLPRLRLVLAGVDYDPLSANYNGLFHCRFWHYGQWVDIYVDDCLPVHKNPGAPKGFSLIGAHSPDKDALWVALVEKALAKFHGSYRAIEAREREYGWRLLTGGVPYIIEQEKLRRMPSDRLFERIKTALDAGSVVTCSHQTQGGRLHAYTVTGAAKHSTKGNVIRIRNPWGEERIRISWLETPENWTYTDEEDKEDFECKDGEFWVMRGQCYSEFSQFCIGSYQADYYEETSKEITLLEHKYTFYGEWAGETAAGNQITDVFKNPKYRINVKGSKAKKKKLLLELIPRPVENNKGISLYLYKITRLKPFRATLCQNMKGAETPVFLANGCPQFSYELSPGSYMAVPLSQTSKDEREFCLRVFSKSAIICQEISGTFFHQIDQTNGPSRDSAARDSVRFHHLSGLWKGNIFTNEQTYSSVLGKLSQFHLKVPVETNLTIRLCQEFTSTNDYMKFEIYKTTESIHHAIDQTFLETHRPASHVTPTRIQGPCFTQSTNLLPGNTYGILVYPWCATVDRHFVLSLGWAATETVHIKSFNTS